MFLAEGLPRLSRARRVLVYETKPLISCKIDAAPVIPMSTITIPTASTALYDADGQPQLSGRVEISLFEDQSKC